MAVCAPSYIDAYVDNSPRATPRPRPQALHHGAAAALWQSALRLEGIPPPPLALPSLGAAASLRRDGLACALATALGDLFVNRGDDAVGVTALLVVTDVQYAAWYGAQVHASRPPSVAAVAGYLNWRIVASICSCLGVRARRRLSAHQLAASVI